MNVGIVLAEDAIPTLEIEATTAYFAAKSSFAVQDRANLFAPQSGLTPSMDNESAFFLAFERFDIVEDLVVKA